MNIKQNIEQLFNTTKTQLTISSDLNYAKKSILNYGIPEFNNNTRPSDYRSFCQQIQQAINLYETRLSHASIDHIETSKNTAAIDLIISASIKESHANLLLASKIEPLTKTIATRWEEYDV